MRFSSLYGSYEVLNLYLSGGLVGLPQPASFHWQHGWKPRQWPPDPDLIIGEGGWARLWKDHVFLVARQDQVSALVALGFERAVAFGLPFAYALKVCEKGQARKTGTLLVLPADHQTSEGSKAKPMVDQDYIASMLEVRSSFSKITVLLHSEDMNRGRDKSWVSAGFEVVQGANPYDSLSLVKLAERFSETEYCTTNGFGSHIAYAAASGCKISVWGPGGNSFGDIYRQTLYQNRPDLVELLWEGLSKLGLDMVAQGFYCHPLIAVEHREWGLEEIGYDNVLPPHQALALLEKTFKENPLSTIGRLRQLALSRFWTKMLAKGLQINFAKMREAASYLANAFKLANVSLSKAPNRNVTRTVTNLVQILRPGSKLRKLRLLDTGDQVSFRSWSADLASVRKVFGSGNWSSMGGPGVRKIIDVGAGSGYFSAMLGIIFPNAVIEALEPSMKRLEMIGNQARLTSQIKSVKLAIGSHQCTSSVVGAPESKVRLKVVPTIVENCETVEMVTLGEFLSQPRFKDGVDVVRLNLEGMEYEVLRDSGEILTSKVGMLIVKFHNVGWKLSKITAIENFFASQGLAASCEVDEYRVYIFEGARANFRSTSAGGEN